MTCAHMHANLRPNKVDFSESARPDFMHNKVAFNSISFNSIRYGSEVHIEAPPTEDVYLALLTLDGSGVFQQGKTVFKSQPGDIYIINPLFPLAISLSENFKQLTIQLDGKCLQRHVSQLAGYAVKDPLIFQPVSRDEGNREQGFKPLIKTICENINSPGSAMLHKQVAANLEETLISLFVSEFPNNYSETLREEWRFPVPYSVRRAQQYIQQNISETVSMEQLAAVSGVSARALQKAFKNTLGVSPLAYTRKVRLDVARRRLIAASDEGASVTEIAYSCGFGHLSKFAQYYKAQFGENPLETKKYQGGNGQCRARNGQ